MNRNSDEEAKIDEISGVASLFNQKFFADLKTETDIDLENIVYYKVGFCAFFCARYLLFFLFHNSPFKGLNK